MTKTSAQRVAKYRSTPKGRATKLVRDARTRAQAKGAVCTVTADQVASVIQAGYCELTGLPFDMGGALGRMYNPYAPSIDRIDADNPNYTPDNVRIVLAWVNMALNQHGLSVSMPIIKALAKCE